MPDLPKHFRNKSHLGNWIEVDWTPTGLVIKLNGNPVDSQRDPDSYRAEEWGTCPKCGRGSSEGGFLGGYDPDGEKK